MIGNISCGSSFGAETNYEMNLKQGRGAQYDSRKAEEEKAQRDEAQKHDFIKNGEIKIKVTQINDQEVKEFDWQKRRKSSITKLRKKRIQENRVKVI